jgi:hypothetical protein
MNRFSDTLVLPLLALLAALAAGVGLVKTTADRVASARGALETQRAQLREAQLRVQKSGTERDLIERYLPDYNKLSALGFVGEEQRINWLDALRTANQKGGLFGINYDIAAKKPFPHAGVFGAGPISVVQSAMKLRFQMLHEEDLQNLLAKLSQQNAGVFIVNRCSLRRVGTAFAVRFQPNMTAECELGWITAQAPPAAEIGQ